MSIFFNKLYKKQTSGVIIRKIGEKSEISSDFILLSDSKQIVNTDKNFLLARGKLYDAIFNGRNLQEYEK